MVLGLVKRQHEKTDKNKFACSHFSLYSLLMETLRHYHFLKHKI
uniref:Uncharacterized protein n=1 Tax=Myoviridae sp. ctoNH1 TaxID=2826695 RepID=A0A8S5QSP6_9CAUD|nr:MAG TPA: hypothetical protein [Myoviridae sp. ctoNH1]